MLPPKFILWYFQVVPFQNIKTNTLAGDSGKGILYGVCLVLQYIAERTKYAITKHPSH